MEDADADAMILTALEFEPKPSLDDMIAIVDSDILTISGSQRARLICDMLKKPTPEQMQRLAIYRGLKGFLERIKYEPATVAKRLNDSAKRGRHVEA